MSKLNHRPKKDIKYRKEHETNKTQQGKGLIVLQLVSQKEMREWERATFKEKISDNFPKLLRDQATDSRRSIK